MNPGLVQLYTGDGKGKSTASLGLALRALGHGLRVYYLRLMKPRWKTGELSLLPDLHPSLTFRNVEQEWRLHHSQNNPDDIAAMRAALSAEMESLRALLASGSHDLVIVDELLYCLSKQLVTLDDVLSLIDQKPPSTELILTGRGAPPELIARADLVTEMRKHKHPFDQGIPARKGIEF